MKNSKINEALGMLDDDIITEALSEKKVKSGHGARRIAISVIAATLVFAMLAAVLVFALRGRARRIKVASRGRHDHQIHVFFCSDRRKDGIFSIGQLLFG